MGFYIDEAEIRKTFINKKGFQNKVNEKIGIFPFSLSTKGEVESFKNVVGAFFRKLYNKKEPSSRDKETIISQICNDVAFDNENDRVVFCDIIRHLYFEQQDIKCFHLKAYQQLKCNSREEAIAEFMVEILTDKEEFGKKLKEIIKEGNILDNLILKHIEELPEVTKQKTHYYCECPELKKFFMNDLLFLWKADCGDKDAIVRLLEIYFFTSIAMTMIRIETALNRGRKMESEIKLYYCVRWEKTSKNRKCYNNGWRYLEPMCRNMAGHAVLLELLNQNKDGKIYDYKDLIEIFSNGSEEERKNMYAQVKELKRKYIEEYIDDYVFRQREEHENSDIVEELYDFNKVINEQFEGTSRKRAKKAFAEQFQSFAKSVILKNRYSMGYMLELDESDILLLAKLVIGDEDKIRRKEFFRKMENRGIYVDDMTQEQIVQYFEKLNMIEKKSDSGDAQYVKRIF